MTTILPLDDEQNTIPALRLRPGGAQSMAAITGTSARTAMPFAATTRVVSVYATGNVYISFGGTGITASSTDHYYPTGVYYDFAIGGGSVAQYSNLAVLAADSACTVYVSEKE